MDKRIARLEVTVAGDDDCMFGRVDDCMLGRVDDCMFGRVDDRMFGRVDDRMFGRVDDRMNAGRTWCRATFQRRSIEIGSDGAPFALCNCHSSHSTSHNDHAYTHIVTSTLRQLQTHTHAHTHTHIPCSCQSLLTHFNNDLYAAHQYVTKVSIHTPIPITAHMYKHTSHAHTHHRTHV